jgi:alkylresorcinol/alkylpyrone synthase
MPAVPRLLALTTAVPPHALPQEQVKAWARDFFKDRSRDIERLLPAFDNAGIDNRYSCVPLAWYGEPHGWEEKNRLYLENAVDILEQTARDALTAAGLEGSDIDAIVVASTSGIATPSLDARLKSRLGLRNDVLRLPIFGLGCAGGVLGLARAADLARSAPHRKVLFLVVELCGLTFRGTDLSKSNIIATALFGDGAGAAVIGCDGEGPALTQWGEHTWPDSLDVMGWLVQDDGLGVLFSHDIPTIVRREFRNATESYLTAGGQNLADIDGFLCHPGGTKVIQAIEAAFDMPAGALEHSRVILRDYGNMSAATLMFVIERAITAAIPGRYLASALGPGFCAGFLTIEMP